MSRDVFDDEVVLRGRRVLITGGSSGIGAETARRLARRGALVAVLARRQALLSGLAESEGVVPVVADLREAHSVPAAVDAAVKELGGLDALVNNAGAFLLGPVSSTPAENWQTMVDVNIVGLLAVTRAALPHLRKGRPGSTIVNVSSMGGRRVAQPVQGVYAATKHAVHAISDGLRAEVHADGIRVTVISPGFVRTNLGAGIEDDAARAGMRQGQERSGLRPEHVANQIIYVLQAPPDVSIVEIATMSIRQSPA